VRETETRERDRKREREREREKERHREKRGKKKVKNLRPKRKNNIIHFFSALSFSKRKLIYIL